MAGEDTEHRLGWLGTGRMGSALVRRLLAAGCDVALHCSGKMEEMVAVASAVPPMSSEGEARLARAMASTMVDDEGPSFADALAKRDALLALV